MDIAIIPARGGSKRIPRKNIRDFAGKPMLAYAIAAALESQLFEHIIVSTDDAEIARISKSLGADVPFMRPAELADDQTPTVPVVRSAIEACAEIGWHPDIVCCIYPCVPFLSVEDIMAARTRLAASGADYAFPVARFDAAPQRALRRLDNGQCTPAYPAFEFTRTQDLEPLFFDAGQFYCGKTSAWLAERAIHSNAISIEIPSWRVVDIDTPEDWDRAVRFHEVWRASSSR